MLRYIVRCDIEIRNLINNHCCKTEHYLFFSIHVKSHLQGWFSRLRLQDQRDEAATTKSRARDGRQPSGSQPPSFEVFSSQALALVLTVVLTEASTEPDITNQQVKTKIR